MDSSPFDGVIRKKDSWSKLPPEAVRLLKTLVIKLWPPGEDVNDVCVRQLKGALTNEVFECSWNTSSDHGDLDDADGNARETWLDLPNGKQRRVVLVRLYGTGVDNFFSREDEIRTFEAMSRAGQGPRLLGRFSTGRVEEFLHARTLTAKDLRDPDVSARIAEKLREFHQLSMPGSPEPRIWNRLRDWLTEALGISSSAEYITEFRLHELNVEIEDLELQASNLHSDIGFCHNDLQYGNIMMDDETNIITIIDYEYSTYNPVAYDLANHFCEMAANYHTDTPHILDFSKYPGLKERHRFIRAYLESSGDIASVSQVKQLSDEVDFYVLASHIHWGLWGLISHYVNEIDFDYLEYARQRFNQFWAFKGINFVS
ncbi:hypothetical protein GOP47_0010995 [Adiantum capillus-veneris]|uniref:Choline kinase n=1 Tax=Adiantum capillus-veneris TaxID=13818 RepID=A0A9D4UW03_ADICA|nr:hypothetical protein GOP47_0010995 [Adiantum capillus-veneris]